MLAQKRMGGTPWHAHHIVERNSLLTIIALGEGVVGTVASLSAVVADQGWTTDAVLVAVAGTGLTFGMWWVYFVVPAADLLTPIASAPSATATYTFRCSGRSSPPVPACMLPRTTSNTGRNWVRLPP